MKRALLRTKVPWKGSVNAQTRNDVVAGGIFALLGTGFALTARTYEMGSLLRMGPGYFPFVFGLLLVALGMVIGLTGLLLPRKAAQDVAEESDQGRIPWRRGALVLGAIMVFGLATPVAGLAPSLLVATFLAALAGEGTRPLGALVIALGLTLLCLVIFVLLLQLKLPLFIGILN